MRVPISETLLQVKLILLGICVRLEICEINNKKGYKKGEFVYYHWGFISIYRLLTLPLKSLVKIIKQ